jgi:hypothetical protein
MKTELRVGMVVAMLTAGQLLPGLGTGDCLAFVFVWGESTWLGLGGSYSVAVGDFNGDGKLDLAVANYTQNQSRPDSEPGSVAVLLGEGDGSFQDPVNYDAGQAPRAVAVGDFNGDGKLDLAVASYWGGIQILLGNGDGTFRAAVRYEAGTGSYAVVVADFNNDGKEDLAVANSQIGVSILLGNGDGSFQLPVEHFFGIPGSGNLDFFDIRDPVLAVSDFNLDGKPDIAILNSVLLGNGDGTFQPAITHDTGTGGDDSAVAVGDFNGDGKPDFAVVGRDNVTVFLGKGDGTFSRPVNYQLSMDGEHHSVMVGDLNGDGALDMVVVGAGVSVFLGNGDGTFQGPSYDEQIGSPYSAALGDFNGDGRPDLVTAILPEVGGVTVWLNTAEVTSGSMVEWGNPATVGGPPPAPSDTTNVIAIAVPWGANNGTALWEDGTVQEWGDSPGPTVQEWGDFNGHEVLTNVVAIAAGFDRKIALKANGTVVAWYLDDRIQTDVPPDLTNVVAVAAGWGGLALRSDGTVTSWGSQPKPPVDLTNGVAVAAGADFGLALRSDGHVLAWGDDSMGQTDLPSGLTNVVAIAAGIYHSVALRADGTVAVWGRYVDEAASINVPATTPPGISNVVGIAASFRGDLVLKADGSVSGFGLFNPRVNMPTNLTNNIFALAPQGNLSLALVGHPPLTHAAITKAKRDLSGFSCSIPSQSGKVYALEYEDPLTANVWVALPLVAGSGGELILRDPTPSDNARFYRVKQW